MKGLKSERRACIARVATGRQAAGGGYDAVRGEEVWDQNLIQKRVNGGPRFSSSYARALYIVLSIYRFVIVVNEIERQRQYVYLE